TRSAVEAGASDHRDLRVRGPLERLLRTTNLPELRGALHGRVGAVLLQEPTNAVRTGADALADGGGDHDDAAGHRGVLQHAAVLHPGNRHVRDQRLTRREVSGHEGTGYRIH